MSERLLVLSDSHGYSSRLGSLLMKAESMGPLNGVLHLGDGYSDLDGYALALPSLFRVRGNCDFCCPGDKELVFSCFGAPLLMTHGHLYQVKSTLSLLTDRAREAGVKAALFGHTHEPYNEDAGGLLLLNPGAACDGHFSILTIDDAGELYAQMF